MSGDMHYIHMQIFNGVRQIYVFSNFSGSLTERGPRRLVSSQHRSYRTTVKGGKKASIPVNLWCSWDLGCRAKQSDPFTTFQPTQPAHL